MSFPFIHEISFSAFLKNIGKEYKKPKRLTDICDYCEFGKSLKLELIEHAVDFDFVSNTNELDANELKMFFENILPENNEE